MRISEIIKLEQSNNNLIYFSVDNSNNFVAYGLSAYILSRAYSSSITLELKDLGKGAKDTLVAIIPPELISEHFVGENVLAGDDYIKVDLTDTFGSEIPVWRNEFKNRNKKNI